MYLYLLAARGEIGIYMKEHDRTSENECPGKSETGAAFVGTIHPHSRSTVARSRTRMVHAKRVSYPANNVIMGISPGMVNQLMQSFGS